MGCIICSLRCACHGFVLSIARRQERVPEENPADDLRNILSPISAPVPDRVWKRGPKKNKRKRNFFFSSFSVSLPFAIVPVAHVVLNISVRLRLLRWGREKFFGEKLRIGIKKNKIKFFFR